MNTDGPQNTRNTQNTQNTEESTVKGEFMVKENSMVNEEFMVEEEFLFKDECYAIIGACFEVYKEKGCGFHEAVYHECLEIELTMRKIPFHKQVGFPLSYKGVSLKQTYKPDMICHEKIIIELKAVTELIDKHRSQLHNYLKASGLRVGYLMNFGHYPNLEYERIII
jgi:GxxExxY protein